MEQTSDLSKFKEHVELYEFLMERAHKRTTDIVMPRIKALQDLMQNEIESSEKRLKQIEEDTFEPTEYYKRKKEAIRNSPFQDPVFLGGIFFIFLVLVYAYTKYGKQLRLF